MTYGVVVTLLVLALIATVIAVTLTTNQQPLNKPEVEPEPDGRLAVGDRLADVEPQGVAPLIERERIEEPMNREIAQSDEREFAGVPEEAADDSGPVRV
jgi:hypothetical protein